MVTTDELLYLKNVGARSHAMFFSLDEGLAKAFGPFWRYQLDCQFSQFTAKTDKMGWIGSAVQLVAPKRPQNFDFFLGDEYSCYMKSIATYAPKKDIICNSFLGSVNYIYVVGTR